MFCLHLMVFLGDPCQQRSWRSLEPPPSWSLKLCGEAAMVTNPNALKICQQVVQLNSSKPYKDVMVWLLLTKYIWPRQSSLFFLQFGDRVFKTFLGGGHLLPGSPERLQHSVHAGEESRWAESVHQQLSVVAPSAAVSVDPHKKCFRLESGQLWWYLKSPFTWWTMLRLMVTLPLAMVGKPKRLSTFSSPEVPPQYLTHGVLANHVK